MKVFNKIQLAGLVIVVVNLINFLFIKSNEGIKIELHKKIENNKGEHLLNLLDENAVEKQTKDIDEEKEELNEAQERELDEAIAGR